MYCTSHSRPPCSCTNRPHAGWAGPSILQAGHTVHRHPHDRSHLRLMREREKNVRVQVRLEWSGRSTLRLARQASDVKEPSSVRPAQPLPRNVPPTRAPYADLGAQSSSSDLSGPSI